jgi:hypothetical protein
MYSKLCYVLLSLLMISAGALTLALPEESHKNLLDDWYIYSVSHLSDREKNLLAQYLYYSVLQEEAAEASRRYKTSVEFKQGATPTQVFFTLEAVLDSIHRGKNTSADLRYAIDFVTNYLAHFIRLHASSLTPYELYGYIRTILLRFYRTLYPHLNNTSITIFSASETIYLPNPQENPRAA